MSRSLALWGPVLALAAVLFALSHQPAIPMAEVVWDKLSHFVAYLVFGLLALRATHEGGPALRAGAAAAAFALTAAYAISDEVHQSFVPGRSSSVLDVVADVAGGIAAVALYPWAGRVGAALLRWGRGGREK